jgi:signal peptidase I
VVIEVRSPNGGRHAAPRRAPAIAAVPAVAARVLRALVVAAIVCVVAGIGAGKYVLHLGMSPVLTGSMRPSFAPGDAIVTRPVAVSSLHAGMVVVFVPPGHAEAYAHRIVSMTGNHDRPVLVTKGDANPAPDRWRVTLTSPTVPRVVGSVPKAGYVLASLREPRWRAGVIGALGLLMTALLTRSVLGSRPRSPSGRPAHAH